MADAKFGERKSVSQIPFHLGNEIARNMGIPDRWYRKCFYALVPGNGLGMLAGELAKNEKREKQKKKKNQEKQEKDSFSWDSAAVVLRHVDLPDSGFQQTHGIYLHP